MVLGSTKWLVNNTNNLAVIIKQSDYLFEISGHLVYIYHVIWQILLNSMILFNHLLLLNCLLMYTM